MRESNASILAFPHRAPICIIFFFRETTHGFTWTVLVLAFQTNSLGLSIHTLLLMEIEQHIQTLDLDFGGVSSGYLKVEEMLLAHLSQILDKYSDLSSLAVCFLYLSSTFRPFSLPSLYLVLISLSGCSVLLVFWLALARLDQVPWGDWPDGIVGGPYRRPLSLGWFLYALGVACPSLFL